jgi:hypothetical protein
MLRFTVFLIVFFSGLQVAAQRLQSGFSEKNEPYRSEICILHCRADSVTQTAIVQLEYLQTDSFLPPDILIVRFSDNNGKISESLITANAFCSSVCIPEIAPTAVPATILGTEHYYQWRNNDCQLRQQLSGQPISVPDYYLDYGDKYSRRFLLETRPKLSEEGKIWVDNTLLLLQITTECLLISNAKAEQNSPLFRQQLFDQHTSVYEATGFFQLCFRDKLIIVNTLDFRDLISKEGLIQVKTIAVQYLHYLIKRRLSIVFPRLFAD